VKKYLAAARAVADHLVLKPDGFAFATHPVVTETDRDKYCVRRIIEFYRRHRVDYADYFQAAWRYQHRGALGEPEAPMGPFAAEAGLSEKSLTTVWSTLLEPWPVESPLGQVQAPWRGLPGDARQHEEARRGCERIRDLVIRLRQGFEPQVGKLQLK